MTVPSPLVPDVCGGITDRRRRSNHYRSQIGRLTTQKIQIIAFRDGCLLLFTTTGCIHNFFIGTSVVNRE